MMKCRWWDSNPHGFPNDFESFASAIPPHRLIFNFGTLVPVSEDWRDVQEGCKKSCFNKLSKFNEYSWISCTDTKNHEADFGPPRPPPPTHGGFWCVEKKKNKMAPSPKNQDAACNSANFCFFPAAVLPDSPSRLAQIPPVSFFPLYLPRFVGIWPPFDRAKRMIFPKNTLQTSKK